MKKGFTLIELLIVVLIIGILTAIALPQYEKAVERAMATQVVSDINMFEKALEMLYLSNGGVADIPQDGFFSSMDIQCSSDSKVCVRDLDEGWRFIWYGSGNAAKGYYELAGQYSYSGGSGPGQVILRRSASGWYKSCTGGYAIGKTLCTMLADRPGWEIK